ncbi:hypothetical protein LJX92_00850 [Pseudomonas sp. HN8-3]|nr:hypothetical protein LJX92_00850 [Pseudomonas sp. HN8-3]
MSRTRASTAWRLTWTARAKPTCISRAKGQSSQTT